MPGQVNGQHIEAMVCQVTCLQNPNAVVVEHAVNEHHCGLAGLKRFTACVGIGLVGLSVSVFEGDVHAEYSSDAVFFIW